MVKIRCPKCSWEPDGKAYWWCSRCHHVWNTFETTACCPACHFQHIYTQCVASAGGCTCRSLHEDWYEGLNDGIEKLMHEIAIKPEIFNQS